MRRILTCRAWRGISAWQQEVLQVQAMAKQTAERNGKLESVGLVTHETVIQTGKPNKNVYSILPAGREELLRWLSEQGRPTDGYKSEFLMKVFFAENLPPQQAIALLRAYADECRAWTIKKGTKAPQAAGKIHSDFERGFIRAEVIAFDDLKACGTLANAKAKGLLRSEGKEYVMHDGDVVNFLFNV